MASTTMEEPTITKDLAGIQARVRALETLYDTRAREHFGLRGIDRPGPFDPLPSTLERMQARRRLPALEEEMRDTAVQLEEAKAELAVAEAAHVRRLRDEFQAKKRSVIARLTKALDQAASVNAEYARLEEAEAQACGFVDRGSWHQLLPSTELMTSRLDEWKQWARSNGLLD